MNGLIGAGRKPAERSPCCRLLEKASMTLAVITSATCCRSCKTLAAFAAQFDGALLRIDPITKVKDSLRVLDLTMGERPARAWLKP